MKTYHQKVNPTVETRTTVQLMVTAKYLTNYTQEQLEKTSRNDTIITKHHSKTEERQMHHPLKICMGSKGQIQRNTDL